MPPPPRLLPPDSHACFRFKALAGTGDLDRDGRSDILWRSDTGQLSDWLDQANGGFADNGANANAAVPIVWQTQPVHDLLI